MLSSEMSRIESLGSVKMLAGIGAASSVTAQMAEFQKRTKAALAFDMSSVVRDISAASKLADQVSQIQWEVADAFRVDTAKMLADIGAASSVTAQMAEIQRQARAAFAFDAASVLRDASAASALARQVTHLQKQVADVSTLDTKAILEEFDVGQAESALEGGNLQELEEAVPPSLNLDDAGVLPAVAVAVLLAALLHFVGAALFHIATEAAESASDNALLILQAADAVYAHSSETRGLVVLLTVVAAIKTFSE